MGITQRWPMIERQPSGLCTQQQAENWYRIGTSLKALAWKPCISRKCVSFPSWVPTVRVRSPAFCPLVISQLGWRVPG